MTTDQKIAEPKGFARNKLKYSVNEKFFDAWTNQMAYVLGFTFADGNIYKASLSWDLQKKDKEILIKIKRSLSATYSIQLQRKSSYRLRINNQILVSGAISRGLLPKKNIRNELPNIPNQYLRHFIRGYLDGDGWVVFRKNKKEFDLGFSSGNKEFLDLLSQTIFKILDTKTNVRERLKVTPRGIRSVTYMMEYYASNAFKIARWLFEDLESTDLYLNRKYKVYLRGKDYRNYTASGTKIVRLVQRKLGKPLREILDDLHIQKGYDGVQIAKILNVHSSSIYRWLAREGIKYPTKRLQQSYG